MMKNANLVFFILSSALLLVTIIYFLLYFRLDKKEILDDIYTNAKKLSKGPISKLLNGSGIDNIPDLEIQTTNVELSKANHCANGAVYLGDIVASDYDCIQTCVNKDAKVINVHNNDSIIYNSVYLKKGAYCHLGSRPECNMKMAIAIMTINSIVCKSRFPRLVGGTYGSTIVACNNQHIQDPHNILWDNRRQQRFDPYLTDIVSEEELLEGSNEFRFVCHFDGLDDKHNKYEEHPFDRFHPIKNYCKSLIYSAHDDIKMKFVNNNTTYECDCGNPEITRARLLYADDKKSQCSNSQFKIEKGKKDLLHATIPYKCFNENSVIHDAGMYLPCSNFESENQIDETKLTFSEKTMDAVEFFDYENLPNPSLNVLQRVIENP